jgi:lipoate-protein ligase B
MELNREEINEERYQLRPSRSGKHCYCVEIDLIEYRKAWELQSNLVRARKDGIFDRDIILILEHPPVFTLGRRGGLDNLKIPKAFVERRGIEIVHVERGGDITYHGPGQLVIYPIMDLRSRGWKVVEFVGALEEIMIRTAADFGINAERNSTNRGIWVGRKKLGSVGIAIRHEISFHGIAINVNISMEPFTWINPCGLEMVQMTAMKDIIGRDIPREDVQQSASAHMQEIFHVALEKVSLEFVYNRLGGTIRKSAES